jgi:diguanylate cyclase (GGDEF)-like protein
MAQSLPENWAFIYFMIILSITCAQMLVVYVLSDSSNPPAGLSLYTVYFMAALLGWIALTLQQRVSAPAGIDIPTLLSILNSYILFLAAGQRGGFSHGRLPLGLLCLAASLGVFFLQPQPLFVLHCAASALFFAAAGMLSAVRGWRRRNIGDGIIAYAALTMVLGMPAAIYQQLASADPGRAQALAFGTHGSAYALVAIGFLASVLIEYQHHLSHLATRDPLTRLLNRRGLEAALQVSLAHASRHGLSTSAIMVDIDHFQEVNDSFGHEAGDLVLRQVANTLQRMSRASDVAARIGGEEFLLILPDTTLDAARVFAERICQAVGEQPLPVDHQRIPVTISLGVACVRGEVDLAQLSAEADRGMYLAKRGGRNRVASVENHSVQLRSAWTTSA